MGGGTAGFFWAAAAVLVSLLATILSGNCPSNAQPISAPPAPGPSPASTSPSASDLDALLQGYAYRAFTRPRTGVVYDAQVPANLSGITLSVVRLRSGSFRTRGLQYNQFDLPAGVVVTPYVVRLALVYQNLGNWSKAYYGVPGYTLVTPVVGLLAYDAADLSATGLPELTISPTGKPISVSLAGLSSVTGTRQLAPPVMCVHFPVNGGAYGITGLVSGDLCTATDQGHFALVVNSSVLAPSPAPSISPGPSPAGPPPPPPVPIKQKKSESKVWKIAAAVVGGFLGLILLALLLLWMRRFRQKKKMTEMVKQSEAGEVLKAQRVGSAQLPAAPMVRTRPALENDYVP